MIIELVKIFGWGTCGHVRIVTYAVQSLHPTVDVASTSDAIGQCFAWWIKAQPPSVEAATNACLKPALPLQSPFPAVK